MTLVKADGTGTYLRLGVSAGGQTGTLRKSCLRTARRRGSRAGRAPRTAALLEHDRRPLSAHGRGRLVATGVQGAPT